MSQLFPSGGQSIGAFQQAANGHYFLLFMPTPSRAGSQLGTPSAQSRVWQLVGTPLEECTSPRWRWGCACRIGSWLLPSPGNKRHCPDHRLLPILCQKKKTEEREAVPKDKESSSHSFSLLNTCELRIWAEKKKESGQKVDSRTGRWGWLVSDSQNVRNFFIG